MGVKSNRDLGAVTGRPLPPTFTLPLTCKRHWRFSTAQSSCTSYNICVVFSFDSHHWFAVPQWPRIGISRRNSPAVRPALSWLTPPSLFFPRAASSNNNTTLDILPILHWSDVWKISSATAPWLHREQQVGLTTASSAQPSPSTSPPAAARPGKFPYLLAKIINWLLLHACVNHSRMPATVASRVIGLDQWPDSFFKFWDQAT